MTRFDITLRPGTGLEYASREEDQWRRDDHIRMRPINGPRRAGGSTSQSLGRGLRSTEADYLNGGCGSLARRLVAERVTRAR